MFIMNDGVSTCKDVLNGWKRYKRFDYYKERAGESVLNGDNTIFTICFGSATHKKRL